MCRLPFNLEESVSACKRWLMGKINTVSHSAINSNTGINAGQGNWLRCGTQKSSVCTGSFQEAIGSTLVLAQLFGLMPVVGVKSSSASQLRFKWNSSRTLYSFVVFLLLLAYAIMTVMVSFESQIHFDRVGESRLDHLWKTNVIFLLCSSSCVFLVNHVRCRLFRDTRWSHILYSFGALKTTIEISLCINFLATKWPRMMKHWESVEAKMPKYRSPEEKGRLARHVKMLSVISISILQTLPFLFVVFLVCGAHVLVGGARSNNILNRSLFNILPAPRKSIQRIVESTTIATLCLYAVQCFNRTFGQVYHACCHIVSSSERNISYDHTILHFPFSIF